MLQGYIFFTSHSLARGLYTGVLNLDVFSVPNCTMAATLLRARGRSPGAVLPSAAVGARGDPSPPESRCGCSGAELGCAGTRVPLSLQRSLGSQRVTLSQPAQRRVSNCPHGSPTAPAVTFALPVAVGGITQVPGVFSVELCHQ